MNRRLRGQARRSSSASILVLGCCASSFADDAESSHQLTLADLAAYRAALTGKATRDDAQSVRPAGPREFQRHLESPRRISRPPRDGPGTRRTDLSPGAGR